MAIYKDSIRTDYAKRRQLLQYSSIWTDEYTNGLRGYAMNGRTDGLHETRLFIDQSRMHSDAYRHFIYL